MPLPFPLPHSVEDNQKTEKSSQGKGRKKKSATPSEEVKETKTGKNYIIKITYLKWKLEKDELSSTAEKPKRVIKKKTASKKSRKSKKEKEVTPVEESNRTFPDYLAGNEGSVVSQGEQANQSTIVLPSVKKMMQTKKDKQQEVMLKMKQHLD